MNGGNVGGVTTDIVDKKALLGANILDNDNVPTPVYTGYTLQGWAYDAEGTQLVGATDNITADLTVYAVWLAKG